MSWILVTKGWCGLGVFTQIWFPKTTFLKRRLTATDPPAHAFTINPRRPCDIGKEWEAADGLRIDLERAQAQIGKVPLQAGSVEWPTTETKPL